MKTNNNFNNTKVDNNDSDIEFICIKKSKCKLLYDKDIVILNNSNSTTSIYIFVITNLKRFVF